MEIRLISHASVVIKTDISIWTDPWLFGKAFNDSWSLFPPAVEVDDSFYEGIDHLFISHEHPDHFHIPTLRSLPESFKHRVNVLFQENNSDKVFKALRQFGFPNVTALRHDKVISLTDKTSVYCYEAGSMDSALGVIEGGKTALNVNDCELNAKDCRRIRRSLGNIGVVLNQFSIAGYSGFKDRDKFLPNQARNVLKKMLANHIDLGADVTVPFASFIYFSREDNRYMNEFSNRPQDAFDFFRENGKRMDVLFPGDTYPVGSAHVSAPALDRFRALYSESSLEMDPSPAVPLSEIFASFHKLASHIHEKYPKTLLRLLKPVTVKIPDLQTTVVFSIAAGEIRETPDSDPDLVIGSQPLNFAFSFPYGIQTLGVSGRYVLVKGFPNWRRHRILFSMNNAELYLKPRLLFTKRNLSFFRNRLPGAWNQLTYRWKVMR